MFDVEKIKSIMPTSQGIMLVILFTKIQFHIYSKILEGAVMQITL